MRSSRKLLTDTLRKRVQQILTDHPELPHVWKANSHLVFPRLTESGFDVEVLVDGSGIVVSALGAHEHFGQSDGSAAEIVDAALGLVRDLLSPGMRLWEKRAGRMPCRWKLESQTAESWHAESETGLLLFNFFGRRSERVYQNHHLPIRLGNAV